jgi:glycolate oxidase iron-sulfur subunit
MSDLQALGNLMRELEAQLVVCMRCGMCQSVCALYQQTGREADVARGKLALLDGLMHEMFTDPEGVYQRLNKCLLCGSCAAACPSGVKVTEIFLKARAILTAYMGLPPAKRIVLRGMLAHPALFDRIAEWGAGFGRIFTRPVNAVIGTSCARFAAPLLAERHFRLPAATPFHRRVPQLDVPPSEPDGPRAALFVGCLIDKFFPGIARDSVAVLRHHGAGVRIPPDQGCCGIPALSAGDSPTFLNLLAHNLERFDPQDWDVLVTACATCTSTIRKVWPMMARAAGSPLAEKAQALADKTMDISQYIAGRFTLTEGRGPEGRPAEVLSYHDPCHLKKSLGVSAEPRALIAANRRYRLQEMVEPDACCGMGGSFNLQYYEISRRIGRRKRDAVAATGCSVLATSCPACMLQISDALSQAGDRIRLRHPVEIYAETLGGDAERRP